MPAWRVFDKTGNAPIPRDTSVPIVDLQSAAAPGKRCYSQYEDPDSDDDDDDYDKSPQEWMQRVIKDKTAKLNASTNKAKKGKGMKNAPQATTVITPPPTHTHTQSSVPVRNPLSLF